MSFSSLIRRDHNVYILGAGFSYDAGLPLIGNFLNRMRDSLDWLNKHNRDKELQAIERVFEFRLKSAGAAYRAYIDVENIEELFSLASASDWSSPTTDITWAIAATLDYAKSVSQVPERGMRISTPLYTAPDIWGPGESQDAGIKHFRCPLYHLYARVLSGLFCEESPDAENTVITFNYDTLLEDALLELKVPFHYGFSTPLAEYNNTRWSGPSDNKSFEEYQHLWLPILKLHGSINWAVRDPQRGIISICKDYEQVRERHEQILLVPPTWNKVFGGALTSIWGKALDALKLATRIVVIGFSMPQTDVHFKYLLAAGLRDNISLRQFLFVNPHSDQLTANLYKILRKDLADQGIVRLLKQRTDEFLLYNKGITAINRKYKAGFMDV